MGVTVDFIATEALDVSNVVVSTTSGNVFTDGLLNKCCVLIEVYP